MSEFKPGDVVVHPKYGRGIVRRLVVIDPEDREQVERLELIYLSDEHDECIDTVECMQAALREFANPKPPKPEEPTGLGAVVEDDEGSKWVRVESRTGWWWRNSDGGTRRWDDIDAVRVLGEGVQP